MISVVGRDHECCVVCMACVDFGVGHCLDDVVDVEDEERGRESASLWYSMSDCTHA